jgi:RNA polymerase sigma-70 factor (ECF subfamily)
MNKAAFDALYREHYRRIYGLCRRMLGQAADAEDATQEVFMRGYRSFGRYRPEDPFGPWIGAIASNYCIDVLRGKRRSNDIFREDVETADAADPLENGAGPLIQAEDEDAVNPAVEALPEQYRLPIVLAYYSESSYDEIAETLGITRNHVGVLLLRGKKKLREQLAVQQAEEN